MLQSYCCTKELNSYFLLLVKRKLHTNETQIPSMMNVWQWSEVGFLPPPLPPSGGKAQALLSQSLLKSPVITR